MLEQTPLSPAHSESEWWIRLASFASQTESATLTGNSAEKTAEMVRGQDNKRGLHHKMERPQFLLELTRRVVRMVRGEETRALQDRFSYSEEGSDSVAAGWSSATQDTKSRIQFSRDSSICTPTRAVP